MTASDAGEVVQAIRLMHATSVQHRNWQTMAMLIACDIAFAIGLKVLVCACVASVLSILMAVSRCIKSVSYWTVVMVIIMPMVAVLRLVMLPFLVIKCVAMAPFAAYKAVNAKATVRRANKLRAQIEALRCAYPNEDIDRMLAEIDGIVAATA